MLEGAREMMRCGVSLIVTSRPSPSVTMSGVSTAGSVEASVAGACVAGISVGAGAAVGVDGGAHAASRVTSKVTSKSLRNMVSPFET